MGSFSDGLYAGTHARNSSFERKMGEKRFGMDQQNQDFNQGQVEYKNDLARAQEAAGLATELLQKGGTATREKAMGMLKNLQGQMTQLEQQKGYAPGSLTNVLNISGITPSAQELAQVQGGANATQKVTEARGVAAEAGVPVKEALGFKDPVVNPTEDQRLYKNMIDAGYDEPTAIAVAHGLIDVKQDSDTGEVLLVNKVSGEVKRVGTRPDAATEDAVTATATSTGDGTSETVMGRLPDGVGMTNVIKDGISRIPLIGQIAIDKDTARARQSVRQFNEDAISGIVKNPKFPVAEQERIKNLLPSDTIYENPERAAIAYNEVAKVFKGTLATDQKKLDTGELTKTQAGDLVQRIETLKSLLQRLGTEEDYKLATMPQVDIENLIQNPSSKSEFEKIHGKGMADKTIKSMYMNINPQKMSEDLFLMLDEQEQERWLEQYGE